MRPLAALACSLASLLAPPPRMFSLPPCSLTHVPQEYFERAAAVHIDLPGPSNLFEAAGPSKAAYEDADEDMFASGEGPAVHAVLRCALHAMHAALCSAACRLAAVLQGRAGTSCAPRRVSIVGEGRKRGCWRVAFQPGQTLPN